MFAFVKIVTGDVRVTRSICRSKNLHFGFFKESKPNFGYIHLKTPNSFLECQNKNIQISEFNQFRKICQNNNWILVEINWNLLKIVSYYIIQLCWRVWLIFKTKNQVSRYVLPTQFYGFYRMFRKLSTLNMPYIMIMAIRKTRVSQQYSYNGTELVRRRSNYN